MTSGVQKEMDTKSLLKALNDLKAVGHIAQITLLNNTPSDWDAIVIAAGVKFFYQDGTDFTDGPREVNLSAGATATFMSNKPNGCVQGFALAATVQVGNESPQNITFADTTKPDECLIHETVALGPKSVVRQADELRSRADRIELRKVG